MRATYFCFNNVFRFGYNRKDTKISATSNNGRGNGKPWENPLEGDRIFEEYYYEPDYQQLDDDYLQAHLESSYEQLDAFSRVRFEQTYQTFTSRFPRNVTVVTDFFISTF
jgi:hypothetical protein